MFVFHGHRLSSKRTSASASVLHGRIEALVKGDSIPAERSQLTERQKLPKKLEMLTPRVAGLVTKGIWGWNSGSVLWIRSECSTK